MDYSDYSNIEQEAKYWKYVEIIKLLAHPGLLISARATLSRFFRGFNGAWLVSAMRAALFQLDQAHLAGEIWPARPL